MVLRQHAAGPAHGSGSGRPTRRGAPAAVRSPPPQRVCRPRGAAPPAGAAAGTAAAPPKAERGPRGAPAPAALRGATRHPPPSAAVGGEGLPGGPGAALETDRGGGGKASAPAGAAMPLLRPMASSAGDRDAGPGWRGQRAVTPPRHSASAGPPPLPSPSPARSSAAAPGRIPPAAVPLHTRSPTPRCSRLGRCRRSRPFTASPEEPRVARRGRHLPVAAVGAPGAGRGAGGGSAGAGTAAAARPVAMATGVSAVSGRGLIPAHGERDGRGPGRGRGATRARVARARVCPCPCPRAGAACGHARGRLERGRAWRARVREGASVAVT